MIGGLHDIPCTALLHGWLVEHAAFGFLAIAVIVTLIGQTFPSSGIFGAFRLLPFIQWRNRDHAARGFRRWSNAGLWFVVGGAFVGYSAITNTLIASDLLPYWEQSWRGTMKAKTWTYRFGTPVNLEWLEFSRPYRLAAFGTLEHATGAPESMYAYHGDRRVVLDPPPRHLHHQLLLREGFRLLCSHFYRAIVVFLVLGRESALVFVGCIIALVVVILIGGALSTPGPAHIASVNAERLYQLVGSARRNSPFPDCDRLVFIRYTMDDDRNVSGLVSVCSNESEGQRWVEGMVISGPTSVLISIPVAILELFRSLLPVCKMSLLLWPSLILGYFAAAGLNAASAGLDTASGGNVHLAAGFAVFLTFVTTTSTAEGGSLGDPALAGAIGAWYWMLGMCYTLISCAQTSV